MRFATLRQFDDAGYDLRLWCFRCARGSVVDAIVWVYFAERGWPVDVDAARRRFPCRECRRFDQVAILPARRPPATPAPATWALEVERFFHTSRQRRKMGAIPSRRGRAR